MYIIGREGRFEWVEVPKEQDFWQRIEWLLAEWQEGRAVADYQEMLELRDYVSKVNLTEAQKKILQKVSQEEHKQLLSQIKTVESNQLSPASGWHKGRGTNRAIAALCMYLKENPEGLMAERVKKALSQNLYYQRDWQD